MSLDGSSFLDTWSNVDEDANETSFADATTSTTIAPTSPFYITDKLNDSQEKILSLLFVCSGMLSIMGSSTIIYKVVKNRSKATPYDRIMLGLSCSDIVASLSWILTPFLLPRETSPRVWAIGTPGTCSFVGTLSQFAFCAIVYNGVLSFYYLMTVRFAVKRHIFARRYEPYLHVFTILYFLVTSIGGAAIGIYGELDLGMGCWVNDFPQGCELVDNGESCISDEIGLAFGAGPTALTLLALIINNVVIYIHVKRTLMEKQPDGGATSASSTAASSTGGGGGAAAADTLSVSSRSQQSQERAEQHKKHIREVATQGFLYVASFLVAYTPGIALRLIEAYGSYPLAEQPIFPLFVLNSIFLPLQGFFNMFVYVRPSFVRLQTAYPDLSLRQLIQKACLDSDIPSLVEASRMSTSRSITRMKSWSRASRPNHTSSGKHFSSNLEVLKEEDSRQDLSDASSSSSTSIIDVEDNAAATTTPTATMPLAMNNENRSLPPATTTKPRSLPNMKYDDTANDAENHTEANNEPAKPRSVPNFGECDDSENDDDDDEEEDFDLEAEYAKVFQNGLGGARRIGFDASIQHHPR